MQLDRSNENAYEQFCEIYSAAPEVLNHMIRQRAVRSTGDQISDIFPST